MTSDSSEPSIPSTRRARLETSIAGLLEEGRVDPILGTVINAGIIAIGTVVYIFTTGIPSYVGAFFAIMSAIGIVKWVFSG